MAASSPSPQEVPRTVVSPDEALSIDELSARADDLLRLGKYDRALVDYERILAAEPAGRHAPGALLGAGVALDSSDRYREALPYFERLVREFPEHELAPRAGVFAVRILTYTERTRRAGEMAHRFLDRGRAQQGLRPLEQIALYGAVALHLAEQGDHEGALRFVAKARDLVDAHQLDQAAPESRDLALVYYALGEVRRQKAGDIRLAPITDDFTQRLEQRCQMLLDAQGAYSNAMRAQDPHFSAMSGFRVGELYQDLHDELMKVKPREADLDGSKQDLFEGALRLRYSILLQKAQTMMDHTAAVLDRMDEPAPEQDEWRQRVHRAREEIDASLRREEEALARLPYSRLELQTALDRLARSSEGSD